MSCLKPYNFRLLINGSEKWGNPRPPSSMVIMCPSKKAIWGGIHPFFRHTHVSSIQNPCWLMIIGDYTAQYIGDYNNPIEESL